MRTIADHANAEGPVEPLTRATRVQPLTETRPVLATPAAAAAGATLVAGAFGAGYAAEEAGDD